MRFCPIVALGQDNYDNSDDDIDGIIGSIRMTAEF